LEPILWNFKEILLEEANSLVRWYICLYYMECIFSYR